MLKGLKKKLTNLMKKIITRLLSLLYSNNLHLHYQVHQSGKEELLYVDKNKYTGNSKNRYSLTEREAFIKGKLFKLNN